MIESYTAQDASEYFQYLLDIMNKAERVASSRLGQPLEAASTASAFEFGIETRVQCLESGRVSYKRDAPTNILSLNIPIEAAANKEEVDQYKVRSRTTEHQSSSESKVLCPAYCFHVVQH